MEFWASDQFYRSADVSLYNVKLSEFDRNKEDDKECTENNFGIYGLSGAKPRRNR